MEYKTIRVNVFNDILQEGTWHVISANGTQFWCLNGQIHHEDEPSEIYASEDKPWYLNGQQYMADGLVEK